MKHDLKGIIVPLVTVFDRHENIDENGFRKVVSFLLDRGVHGVFACGGQGEGVSLSRDEKMRLLDICLETVNGRIPVLMGTGTVSTRESIAQTRDAQRAGADAATIITPYYLNPTQDEMYRHYCDILDAVDMPVLIYNNPWRTHLNIQPETVARIREYSSNLVGIKDSSGDLAMTIAYKKLCSPPFNVFIGRDQLIYSGLASGLDGAVAATANAAVDIVVGIYNDYIGGCFADAWGKQEKLTLLRDFFSQGTFPVVVKEAMDLQGLPAGPCRKPVGPLSEEKRERLRIVLSQMGLL